MKHAILLVVALTTAACADPLAPSVVVEAAAVQAQTATTHPPATESLYKPPTQAKPVITPPAPPTPPQAPPVTPPGPPPTPPGHEDAPTCPAGTTLTMGADGIPTCAAPQPQDGLSCPAGFHLVLGEIATCAPD